MQKGEITFMRKFFETTPNKYKAFKITPHQSILNSMNKRFLAALHDVLSMYNNPLSRLSRNGLKLYYRPKDDFWWVISITTGTRENEQGEEETTRQIEFYICITEQFASVFVTKLKNYKQWQKNSIEEVSPHAIKIPEESDVYKLKYQRSNMFSLSYNYTEQSMPIRELLSVSQELEAGEYAGLFVKTDPLSRSKWKNLVDYSWEVWEKGGMPQRNSIDLNRILYKTKESIEIIFTKIKLLLDEILLAIEKSFMDKNNAPEPQNNTEPYVNAERQEILVNGELSVYTRRKRNLPAFNTDIFAVVNSEKKERKGMIIRSISSSCNELKGDNMLNPIKVNTSFNGEEKPNWQNLGQKKDYDANIMSTEELGKIMQLPTQDVQDEFREEIVSDKNIVVEIPKTFLNPKGIFMGISMYRNEKHNIYLPTDDTDMLMTSRAFFGSPRMGKDQACINMIVEAKREHGIGAVIPDAIDERKGHRGMADAIRDHLSPEDVIDLDLGDYDWPVYIGLNSAIQGIKNERIASNRIAQELTNFLMADDIENHQTREHLREAAKLAKGNLNSIKKILTQDDYRNNLLDKYKNQNRDISFWKQYNEFTDSRKNQICSPILYRLGELMGDEVLKPIFCQKPNPMMDFRQWINEGKVVIYRIPSRDMGEGNVKILAYWIVMCTFLTKLSMEGGEKPTFLVLNEPQQFLSRGLIHFSKRLLVEGPKHKIAPIFIFHNFKQLPSDFVDILLSSSLNWHMFKNTNYNSYEKLASYLYPSFTPETAMNSTKRFHYIACWLDSSGEYQNSFMVKAPPMIGDRYQSLDNSWLTRKHSRLYGRKFEEVEEELTANMYEKKLDG